MRRALLALAAVALLGAACGDGDGGAPLVALDRPDAAASLCQPGRWFCTGLLESARCDETGEGVVETVACTAAERCVSGTGECRETLCSPGGTECLDEARFWRCSIDGTYWTDPEPCAAGTLCAGGVCVLARCLANVLLLIDRSGSMQPVWLDVRRSVQRLVAGNPLARFGVTGFPTVYACEVSAAPVVALGAGDIAQAIDDFFSAYPPGGSTPLLAALEVVRAGADSIFGPEGGTLVVVSDGSDTCSEASDVAARLAAVTRSLRDEAAVETWVLGFNALFSPQLLAIAANGGTGEETYTQVGGEAELDRAFDAIVSDIKLCL